MSKLQDLICHAPASSALAFRKTPYGEGDREAFVMDVIALANARVSGPRLLVLGVADAAGSPRKLKGVPRRRLRRLAAAYRRCAAEYIEPWLDMSLRSVQVQDRAVAVIVLRDCDEQPYVVRKSLSSRVRRGDGWIRKGLRQVRLGRTDLMAMFNPVTAAADAGSAIRLVFDSPKSASRLQLPAMPLGKKPSQVAVERLRALLETRQASREALGHTDTRLERLTHARLFGADQPYETSTPESLLLRLGRIEEESRVADLHYEYEQRAHKLNLAVVNGRDEPVSGLTVILEIPRLDGLAVSKRIYLGPGASDRDMPLGYPVVEEDPERFRIEQAVGRVEAGARLRLFKQPLRLALREATVGRTLAFAYTLRARELDKPVRGSLHVQVTADDQRLRALG